MNSSRTTMGGITGPDPVPQLSVIVPLARGETTWRALIQQLHALPTGSEVIVVHARASTKVLDVPTATILLRHCAGAPGRARQQNLGARCARGRWLWFVHADSRLLPGTLPALARFLARSIDALGYFDLAFRGDGPRLVALNAWCANLRSHWLGLPFGDQGFLLPAERFAALGGFDETLRCGEDHRLVWAARRSGLPVISLGSALQTSARKYARCGWLRTTLDHARLTFLQAWPQWHAMRRQRR